MRGFFLVFLCLAMSASAEMRQFLNAEGTKSFSAELTDYDAKSKRVSVRLKNGRIQTFQIDLLSEEDKNYIEANARFLAVGNSLGVTLTRYQDASRKESSGRTVNRVHPSGYAITLNNRSKEVFSNLTLNYTLHYAVQDYLKPERVNQSKAGTLTCKVLPSSGRETFRTDSVDIVAGKLEPVIKNVRRRSGGQDYMEAVVTKEGGRRKDLLVGCKLEVVVDGRVVKSVTDGTIQLQKEEEK